MERKARDVLIQETNYPIKTISGIDTIIAATLIANIGDINRFPNSAKLAKIAGIVPVENSSGQKIISMRKNVERRNKQWCMWSDGW
ncbi:IS110 family transposase [Salinibacillus aidingensis]|uniref:IS110 family transposase n=1 Tax=Salinibacillus aidingensis TaxID=237684 RepID=UPI003CD0743E